jgi:hypothetical protein
MRCRLPLLAAILLLGGFAVAHAQALSGQDLVPAGFGDARQPQVTVSPGGEILVVFGQEHSVYFTKSIDHGQNFSPPAKVGEVPEMLLGMRRGPRIAATAKRIVITAPGPDLVSFVSEDDGATWSQALTINDQPKSANEGLDNIVALPDGSFFAVWLDFRGGAKNVAGARLDPDGTTWDKNIIVYQSPEKSVCPCCHPSVTVDAKGTLTAMWRNSLEGNRDLYVDESTDRGDSFSAAQKLGSGSWLLNACPMDGGNLIAGPDGVVTIWRRQNDIFVDRPGQPETKVATGRQPVVARIEGQLFFAWQARGQLVVTRDSGKTTIGTFAGDYPSLAAAPDGSEGYLVWEKAMGGVSVPQFALLH